MRIAICGKGGSGKSTIAGALARHLAQRGHAVVAVDADPNPNLGVGLGVPRETVETMRPILNALLDAGHTHNTTRQFFGELADDERVVVADLEAGLNDLIWAKPGANDVVLAVSEGSEKSVEIARRAVVVAQELGVTRIIGVANRATSAEDATRIADQLAVAEVVSVPEDPAVEHADQLGVAPMDANPDSPAMVAVRELADLLVK
jgi:CO dehydrogenase maturation factor